MVSDTDPTIITGIIDWQSTCIEPGFICADEEPDFTTYYGLSPLASNIEDATGSRVSEEESKEREIASMCATAYDIILRFNAKKMGAGRALDRTLLGPFTYAATTWRNSAAAARQELIELSQKWDQLGLPGHCPYQPSMEELEEHREQYEDFEAAVKMKRWLVHKLGANSDGWVPNEAWKVAREANKAAFEQWMKVARRSGEINEGKARASWPFHEF